MRSSKDLFSDFISEIEKKYEITIRKREEKIYTKEELSALGFYTLRNLARDMGVRAPTAKRKQILIDEIISIQEKKIVPAKKSTRGRPTK